MVLKESIAAFASDVLKGLTAKYKQLPSKYFYDEKGSKLFQQIMRMPEYYLTDCELEIFEKQKQDILDCFLTYNTKFELIELGAGDGLKTKILLKHFVSADVDFEYVPIDISKKVIVDLTADIKKEIPQLKTRPLIGDYFDLLDQLNKSDDTPKIMLFLGSNIGNYEEEEAIAFFKKLKNVMHPSDQLLIGFDLKKGKRIILDAYDDPHGFTANFNLNLLRRMNTDLGADFDLTKFKHLEIYDEKSGAARSYIVSLEKQIVVFDAMKEKISLEKNEKIHVEISQKYDRKLIKYLAQKSGFNIIRNFTDSKEYFIDSLWQMSTI